MRSLTQIKQELINDILALQSAVKIVEGDTQHDVVVASPANQFYKFEVLLEFERRTNNLDGFKQLIDDTTFKEQFAVVLGFKEDGTQYTTDDVDVLISTRLDAYVADWNITRSPGSQATGIVTVYLLDASPVSWNNGLTFTANNGSTYTPSSAVTNIVPSFSNGVYFVTIPVIAVNVGTSSNAAASSIRTLSPKPTGFTSCINQTAIGGGNDSETDLDLINRAEAAWAKRGDGSVGALELLAGAQTYVDNVTAFDADIPEDDFYIGSTVDVVAQFGSVDSQLVEEFMYWPGDANNAAYEEFDFVFSQQPVVSSFLPIIYRYPVSSSSEADAQQIVNGTDLVDTNQTNVISVISDTGTYAGSVNAMDRVRLRTKLNTTAYQRKLRVLYLRDANPYKLQSVIDNNVNKLIGPPALVKNAVPVPLRVIVEPRISFGYDPATVQAAITSNLLIFFNGGTTSFGVQYARKDIGEDISHSAIADVILRTPGVASYDTDTFYVINTLTGDFRDPSVIKANQYAELLDVLFTFSTVNISNFTASAT